MNVHNLKNTLNCRLKLNKDNIRSFLVAYSTSIKVAHVVKLKLAFME